MKAHTNGFKTDITKLGKELDAKITYQLNGQTIELGAEQLNSVVPHFESSILKSTMKQLDLDSNVDIPLNTILNAQFGLKVNGAYEYLNYGNYVVYSSEKKEDTDSYSIICYDKMLYSMVDYEDLGITYPITIRNYINTICTHLGLTFKNANDTFANYNREIEKELYLDSNGGSLGYTFRDVLDQLAQATASTICINDDTDELEIRYITDTTLETQEAEGASISIPNADSGNINSLELKGNTTQETTNGNQLVDFNNLTTSNATYTFTNDVLTINATGYDHNRVEYDITDVVKNNPGETLKFGYSSVDFSNFTSDNNTLVQLQIITSSSTFKTLAAKSGNSISKTNYAIPSDTSDIRYVYAVFFASASASSNNDSILKLTKPLIYLNNNDTYEPFTNGKSPNPDYPQNIDVVTGGQNIKICRKNIFDKSQSAIIRVSSSYTELENGVRATLTATGTNKFIGIRIGGNELLGKTLTVSAKITPSGGSTGRVRFYFIRGTTTTGAISGSTLTDTGSITFTIPNQFSSETDDGIAILLDSNRNGANASVGDYVDYTNLQIEISNQATEYEAYKGNTYEINLGKNLFNLNDTAYIRQSANTITKSDNTITVTNISETVTGYIWYNVPLEVGKTYTLGYDTMTETTTATNNQIRYILSDNAITSFTSDLGTNNGVSKTTKYATFTATKKWLILILRIAVSNSYTISNLQLEAYSMKTDYAPYKTPIELCKIDTYQDSIKKATGKNLFDKDNEEQILNGKYLDGTTHTIKNATGTSVIYIPCEPNTTYTVSKIQSSRFYIAYTTEFPDTGVATNGDTRSDTQTKLTITTGVNAQYLVAFIYHATYDTTITLQDILDSIQIEKNSTATSYEPYGTGWYIEKQIGKVKLSNSWNWYAQSTNHYQTTLTGDNKLDLAVSGKGYSNFFPVKTSGNDIFLYPILQTGTDYIRMSNAVSQWASLDDFKTFLSNNNVEYIYPLATPTYTKIEDTELINQLENVKLLEGKNEILVGSGGLISPIKINYTSLIDTIDEEYFKDTNVNFGEKYGPVNSIVLSRSESDNVYLQDEQSIAQNGLCEIKISENQIMNWNDRADYLPNILNKLDGLEYYINDFTSTGIMYYDLCDRYFAKIGDIKYKCILFNDEKVIENGLEENIHTDMPEETETDYKKADKTDRKINQTSLIVDKQNQTIEALITETIDGDNPNSLTSRISQTAKSISLSVTDNQTSAGLTIKLYNEDGSEIDSQSGNITLSGLVKFTDLSGSGTTTINGANITTGSISADRIGGGTLTINTSGGGYLSAGANTTHVNVSGLNVTGGAGININNLGFNSDGSKFTFASEIDVPTLLATNRVRTNHIQANGSISIHSGGDDGSYAGNGGIYMATGQISGTPSHITLNANPGLGYVYAEGYNTGRGRVATSTSGPSSKCLKTNIVEFNDIEYEEALKLLNDIKLYDYNYKYNIHPKKDQFGFIIDDLLNNELANKFLYFIDEKANIDKNNHLDYLVEDESKAISFKRYDEETLIKYLLVVCKALQQKINKLEEK